jgi:hypothetical protein
MQLQIKLEKPTLGNGFKLSSIRYVFVALEKGQEN